MGKWWGLVSENLSGQSHHQIWVCGLGQSECPNGSAPWKEEGEKYAVAVSSMGNTTKYYKLTLYAYDINTSHSWIYFLPPAIAWFSPHQLVQSLVWKKAGIGKHTMICKNGNFRFDRKFAMASHTWALAYKIQGFESDKMWINWEIEPPVTLGFMLKKIYICFTICISVDSMFLYGINW